MRGSRFMLNLAAAASALIGPAVVAWADPVATGEEGALAQLLAPRHGARLCFARQYDAQQLDRHPDQRVTAILFELEYFRHEPDQFFADGQRNYYFGLAVQLRDEPAMLFTGGECSPGEGTIWCGVDDDGGGILLERQGDNAIRLDLEATGRIRLGPAGGSELDAFVLEPGLDDRQFVLQKAEQPACRPLQEAFSVGE